jgi:hypothetical protein
MVSTLVILDKSGKYCNKTHINEEFKIYQQNQTL